MKTGVVALASALAPLLLLVFCPAAQACGVCDEDRIAATYDHALVEQARSSHRHIVYAALEGPVDMREAAVRVARVAAHTKGILPASVRVSAEPASISFIADGARSPTAALSDLSRRSGLRVSLIRAVP